MPLCYINIQAGLRRDQNIIMKLIKECTNDGMKAALLLCVTTPIGTVVFVVCILYYYGTIIKIIYYERGERLTRKHCARCSGVCAPVSIQTAAHRSQMEPSPPILHKRGLKDERKEKESGKGKSHVQLGRLHWFWQAVVCEPVQFFQHAASWLIGTTSQRFTQGQSPIFDIVPMDWLIVHNGKQLSHMTRRRTFEAFFLALITITLWTYNTNISNRMIYQILIVPNKCSREVEITLIAPTLHFLTKWHIHTFVGTLAWAFEAGFLTRCCVTSL
jgi:hypothetical protein